MRVRVDSLGCRLNIGEADGLARALAGRGHRIVGPGEPADLMVLNTCAVTHVAGRKSRKLIRHWRRAHPDAALVVTGCYAELSPDEVRRLGVDLLVGNEDKDELPLLLEREGMLDDRQHLPAADAAPLEAGSTVSGRPETAAPRRTRAFVKVQDGCDNKCTFCIVTVARGDSRSRSIDAVVAEIDELVAAGHREAVLSGVHLGSYGHDRGEADGLSRLVRAVLRRTELERLRLSSLEPWDLGDDFFGLWQEDERLLPHVHLPLQSGCDATLQRMARRTDQRSFRRLLRQARREVPDLSITSDVIVGFPGETEAEFEDSLAFVEEMEFAGLHVFRYSPRRGTAADTMPDQVPHPVVQERSRRMHALAERLEARFRRRQMGRTLSVLWESSEPRPEGTLWSGLSDNYARVAAATEAGVDLHNEVTDAVVEGLLPGALAARVERPLRRSPARRAG